MKWIDMFQEDLFQIPGSPRDIQEIRNCLDTGIPADLRILNTPCMEHI